MMSLNENLKGLHLAEKSAIFLEKPADDYVLHVDIQSSELSSGYPQLAVTSCNNTIRLFNRDHLVQMNTISGHEKIVTGVKFSKVNANLLYSSSMDGTVCCWDTRQGVTKEVMCFTGVERTTSKSVMSFDICHDDSFLCAGTEKKKGEDVFMLFWDSRMVEPLGKYSESHHDDIIQIQFDPTCSDRLISGSTDGLVCLFDISQTSEDDALIGTLNSESSVSEIGWCNNGGTRCVYCTTHVETFHMWHATEFDVICNIENTKELFQDKKIDYLVNCVQTEPTQLHLVAGSYSGDVHLLHVATDQLEYVSSLSGGHTEVIRCAAWDSTSHSIISGGEDSMLCLWKMGNDKSTTQQRKAKATSQMKVKLKTSVDYQTRSSKNDGRVRRY